MNMAHRITEVERARRQAAADVHRQHELASIDALTAMRAFVELLQRRVEAGVLPDLGDMHTINAMLSDAVRKPQ